MNQAVVTKEGKRKIEDGDIGAMMREIFRQNPFITMAKVRTTIANLLLQ